MPRLNFLLVLNTLTKTHFQVLAGFILQKNSGAALIHQTGILRTKKKLFGNIFKAFFFPIR